MYLPKLPFSPHGLRQHPTLDAHYTRESAGQTDERVILESRGAGRNNDYSKLLDLVCRAYRGQQLISAAIVPRAGRHCLRVAMLHQTPAIRLPVSLNFPDYDAEVQAEKLLATALRKAMARTGRAPGAKGSGNSTKRLELVFRILP